MDPVVSSPIIIPQIPQRFSEEHLDEYRDEYRNEAVEIFVEHPLPSRIALDLLEDSLSSHGSYGSLRSFTPPPPSCWDRFWSRGCC